MEVSYLHACGMDTSDLDTVDYSFQPSCVLAAASEKRVQQLKCLQNVKGVSFSQDLRAVSSGTSAKSDGSGASCLNGMMPSQQPHGSPGRFSGARPSTELSPRLSSRPVDSLAFSADSPSGRSVDSYSIDSFSGRSADSLSPGHLLTIPQTSQKLSAARRVLAKLDIERRNRESKFDLCGCAASASPLSDFSSSSPVYNNFRTFHND